MRYLLKTSYADDTQLFQHGGQKFWYGLLLTALIVAPWSIGPYWLSQLSLILIYAIAGMGLMVLSGFTGLMSLGHAAFLGVGAYTQALLSNHGWPFPASMAVAALISAGIGIVVGLPALRVKGIYLAIATLAFGFIVEEVLTRWESVTGGNGGLLVDSPKVFAWTLSSNNAVYWLALGTCIIVTFVVLNLMRSATGRALLAVRDSEISAESMGINLARYKTTAFALSAAIVGLAGGLYAHQITYLSPEQFGIGQSMDLLILVAIGGLGSIRGAFLGSIFTISAPQLIALAKDVLPPSIGQVPGLQMVVYGTALVLVVLFEPGGLNGIWLRIRIYGEHFPLYRRGMMRRQRSYQKSEQLH